MIQPTRPQYIDFVESYINALIRALQEQGIEYDFRGSAALLTLAEQLAAHDPLEAKLFAQTAFQIASYAYAIQAGLMPQGQGAGHG